MSYEPWGIHGIGLPSKDHQRTAYPEANDFLAWLNRKIGEPVESPIVKCSTEWSENMVGPMQTVTWKLEPEALDAFHAVFDGR